MWMNETVASGMVPYHHIIGGETGMGEDRRVLEPARQFFNWTAKHDAHFINKRSIANIGVVMGQRTQLFYKPPDRVTTPQYMDGMYYALLEGRFFFDFVHEEKLELENLAEILRARPAEHRTAQRHAVRTNSRLRRGWAVLCSQRSRPACIPNAMSAGAISDWPVSWA